MLKNSFKTIVRLQKHAEEISTVNAERDAAVIKASSFIEKATYIQQLIAEKNKTAMSIENYREKQEQILGECYKSNNQSPHSH